MNCPGCDNLTHAIISGFRDIAQGILTFLLDFSNLKENNSKSGQSPLARGKN